MSDSFIQLLIYAHAFLGGISLITGTIALSSSKGKKVHRSAGKIFVWTLSTAAVVALFISILPKHESPFLFTIGVLSLYFTIAGYRSLRYKTTQDQLLLDKMIAVLLILSSCFMIAYPIILAGKIHILFTVFGALGLLFGIRDLVNFNNPEKLKASWLKLHLGNITGAYISSFTAFIVVNQLIPGIYGWIAPGVLGSFYIAYWTRKVDNK